MNPYKISLFHRELINDGTLISKDTYRFKTRFNRVYFIELECYENNVYIAKFYLRIHKNLKDKYKRVINDGDGFRVLNTCIELARQINLKDPKSSFGFIGESRIGEDIGNTQRFRIYKLISAKHFNPSKYDHVKDDKYSIYFLLNKLNKNLSMDEVSLRLNEYYILE